MEQMLGPTKGPRAEDKYNSTSKLTRPVQLPAEGKEMITSIRSKQQT